MKGLLLPFLLIVSSTRDVIAAQLMRPAVDDLSTVQFFEQWRIYHGRLYGSLQEHASRYRTFVANMKRAAMLNTLREHSEAALFGPTRFADLTDVEFRETVLKTYKKMVRSQHKVYRINFTSTAPTSFDWTDRPGVVTSVKDQGRAGSCWAFAGNANLESQYAIKTGRPCPNLSAESMNDCDGYSNPSQGWVACGPLGATMPAYYQWIKDEGGVMAEKDYPYCLGTEQCAPCAPPGYDAALCGGRWPVRPCRQEDSCGAKYDKAKFVPGLKIKTFGLFTKDENLLKDALVQVGPLVAGIDATDLQLYQGGILKPLKCGTQTLNHVVVLVGYSTTEEIKVWRAKNSWGTEWGEAGYFRIERGVGACGINEEVTSAFLE